MIDALTRVCVLPIWKGPVDPQPMTGGMSNVSFYVEDAGERFVVRFGRDYPQHHVVRSRELMVARAAYRAGFAEEIVHAGPGVVVGRYIDGRSLTGEDIGAQIELITRRLRDFHTQMPPLMSEAGFMFWPPHVVRDHARTLVAEEHPAARDAAQWFAIADEMEQAQIPLPFIIGHNDLIPRYIIQVGDVFLFIDFEYAGFSTCLFDLASLAANADLDAAGVDAMLRAYFEVEPDGGMLRAFDAMRCLATLREALWGLMAELHVTTGSTDFAAYARRNMERFDLALNDYRRRHGTPA